MFSINGISSQFKIHSSFKYKYLITMTLPITSLPEISIEMPQLTMTEASQHFSDLIKNPTIQQQRTLITQSGHGVAVLLPLEDLVLLQQLEDLLSIEAKAILKI